jgi:hypothetical protein
LVAGCFSNVQDHSSLLSGCWWYKCSYHG